MNFQDRISTYPGRYKLKKSDGTSEYVTLERADSPTQVGTPLNADTFNAAFAEKAPSGYGLGVTSPEFVSNPDQATKSGWYRTTDPITGGSGFMCVSAYDAKYIRQDFYNIHSKDGNSKHLVRWMYNGEFSPWEWVNPPMVPNTEYRTTERWNGSPVYVKAINFGNLPNGTRRNIPHGIDGKSENVRYSMKAEQTGRMLPDASITEVIANSTDIYITTNKDLSGYSIVFTLWYTKS